MECHTVLKILKKFCLYLYKIRFVLEVNVATLVAQLNQPVIDLSGSVVVRWITWIHLFDFDMKHVPGMKNMVTNGLSRQLVTEKDIKKMENNDIDEFLNAQFLSIFWVFLIAADLGERLEEFKVNPVEIDNKGDNDRNILEILDEEWSEELQKIAY